VKKNWKIVNICRSYGQLSGGGSFF